MMLNENHRIAQELSSEAADLSARGQVVEARKRYIQAAGFEEQALLEIPRDKPRSAGIIGVSLVAILYKAREYVRAERWTYRLLAVDWMQDPVKTQLRDLLEVITDEMLLLERQDREYVDDGFTVAMRGGQVGWGTAPLDAAHDLSGAVSSLVYRVTECTGGFLFRTKGRPPEEVLSAVQARAAQPSPGSYRYTVRLTRPRQTKLAFETRRVDPTKVTDTLFKLAHLVNEGDSEGLKVLIPDGEYRVGLLKLYRNIVPEGKAVGELELIRRQQQGLEAVTIDPATRKKVNRHIPRLEGGDGRAGSIVGVLRALHLDKHWLELHPDEGKDLVQCDTVPGMLDDVVGPMVNRRVVAHGHWRKKGGGEKFLIGDVELSSDDRLEQV